MITTLIAGLILMPPQTLSVRVDGDGYLRLAREGRIVYAKQTALTIQNGTLTGPKGAELLPRIAVPADVTTLSVTLDGMVSGKASGRKTDLGRLVLALFPKGAKLTATDGYLTATDRPTLQDPGEGLAGVIRTSGGTGAAQNPSVAGTTTKPVAANQGVPVKKTFDGKYEIRVNALSEVSGPKVRLGEVAEIVADAETKAKLEQMDLGAAPMAGIPRPIVTSRIISLVQQAGLKVKDFSIVVPTEARVALKIQKIDSETFVAAAKQAVMQQVGTQLGLTCTQVFPVFNAPMGQILLEPGRVSKNQNGFTVPISILIDGKRLNSRIVNLTVDASSAAIKAGDTVRIYLRSAGATMEVSGRARTGGYLGQQITVVSSTGSTHQATVLSASEVEVKL